MFSSWCVLHRPQLNLGRVCEIIIIYCERHRLDSTLLNAWPVISRQYDLTHLMVADHYAISHKSKATQKSIQQILIEQHIFFSSIRLPDRPKYLTVRMHCSCVTLC